MAKRRGRKMKGKGKVTDLLKRGNKFLKDTQLISKVANTLRDAGVAPKYTGAVGSVASKLGYGKKRRRMRGSGIKEWLGKANQWLRKTGAISKVANALGSVGVPYASSVGKVAGTLGYGRRPRRTMRGRGVGHLLTAYSPVGIAGAATFSRGRI